MALYRLRALGTTPGEIFNFSLHVTSSLSTGDAADAWAQALDSAWTGGLDAYYAPSTVIDTASASLLDQTTGRQQARVDVVTTLAGADATGTPLPPQVAIVVTTVAVLGRAGGLGRFYLPAPTSTAISAGQLSTTALTAISDSMTSLFATLTAASMTTVVYHRPPSPLAGLTDTVIQYRLDSVLDTQRRRRDKLVGSQVGGPV